MANYSLIVNFDHEMVSKFNENNQKLVIVKESEESNVDVAWITFSPFEINDVSWSEEYGLYASCSDVTGQAVIQKSSYVANASEQQLYLFTNGTFNLASTDLSLGENTYEVKNGMPTTTKMLTFGLAQDVTANGINYAGKPINAVPVMYNESATFTPHERIKIFMQSNLDDGMVISRIKSDSLSLDFTDKTDITVKYDSSCGRFVEE